MSTMPGQQVMIRFLFETVTNHDLDRCMVNHTRATFQYTELQPFWCRFAIALSICVITIKYVYTTH